MKISRFVLAMAVVAIAAGSERAFAQNPVPQVPSPQYYGYGGQAPAAAPQGTAACYPPNTACYPEKYGCYVTVCPCPCQSGGGGCIPGIPDIHPPTCYNPCVIYDEKAPPYPPRTIDIWRNCYIPIRIEKKDAPTPVTPVNINVRWREVHFLCGPDGRPLAPEQAAEVLKEFQSQMASAEAPGATASAPQPPAATPAVNPMTAHPAPAAQPAPVAATPPKQWLWISNMNMYGYGYINEGGYAVVDEGSYRATPPAQTAVAPADGLTVAASTTR